MGKVSRCGGNSARCHKENPYLSCCRKAFKKGGSKRKLTKALNKRDWEGATCPVCLEAPHNAVLLLCSSYHKGCRPYLCATSSRFSDCLGQYTKAYTRAPTTENTPGDPVVSLGAEGLGNGKNEIPELLCPLCRGQVKGWTVVEDARKYLNSKKRACMQDKCSFVGNYRQLRKHVKAQHPKARPRAVDPVLEEKWKRLECERDRSDVISTIMSSTPGAIVLGDYVIEPHNGGYEDDEYDSDDSLGGDFLDFEPWRGRSSVRSHIRFLDWDSDEFGMHRFVSSRATAAPGRALRRLLLARSRWARRGNGGGR